MLVAQEVVSHEEPGCYFDHSSQGDDGCPELNELKVAAHDEEGDDDDREESEEHEVEDLVTAQGDGQTLSPFVIQTKSRRA